LLPGRTTNTASMPAVCAACASSSTSVRKSTYVEGTTKIYFQMEGGIQLEQVTKGSMLKL
jgi:hypothetical protein